MAQPTTSVTNGAHFTVTDMGEFMGLDHFTFAHPAVPFEVEGKVFLKERLGLTSAEISLNKLPPNMSVPFYHRHTHNEEIYIFVKGQGEFQIDDHQFPVREGTVIRVAPAGVRCWRNASEEPLYYIVVQAPAGGYQPVGTISDGTNVPKPVRWKPV